MPVKMLMTLCKSHVERTDYQIMIKHFFICLFFFSELHADLWKQDVSSQMKIGIAETGYKRVDLKCGVNSFFVNVTLDNGFEGVVYTRGSFDNKSSSCFKRHDQGIQPDPNSFLMALEIPFNECHTVMDVSDSRYTNILIIQHDPDFIMPGDAAFALDCVFTPEFKMTSNVVMEPDYKSKITLVDADPVSKERSGDPKYQSHSLGDKVSFFPLSNKTKDEL